MTIQRPLRSRFGITFSLIARSWRREIEAHLASVGMSDATWIPLVHLSETGDGISQIALAKRIGIDGSSLVRVIDILVRAGLIERRADESDGRARLIYLTDQGRERVAEIRKELDRAEQSFLTDLSDDDIAVMLAHFKTIDRRMAQRAKDAEGAKD